MNYGWFSMQLSEKWERSFHKIFCMRTPPTGAKATFFFQDKQYKFIENFDYEHLGQQ